MAFVSVTAEGVPRFGVTSVGLVANTNAPLPVSSVTAAARLALEGVARNDATLAPRPEIPVVTGKPVAFVNVTADGVPRFGVVNTGLVANTSAPVPVSSVTAAAICADVATNVLLVRLIVLLVSVCEPVSVATVESIAIVTGAEPLYDTPLRPVPMVKALVAVAVTVIEPPRATLLPLIVIELLVRLALPMFDNVLFVPLIVLLVRVCESVVPTTAPVGPAMFSHSVFAALRRIML